MLHAPTWPMVALAMQLPAVQQHTTPYRDGGRWRRGYQAILEVGCLAVGDELLGSILQGSGNKELAGRRFKVGCLVRVLGTIALPCMRQARVQPDGQYEACIRHIRGMIVCETHVVHSNASR
jgi:hypothetical protein